MADAAFTPLYAKSYASEVTWIVGRHSLAGTDRWSIDPGAHVTLGSDHIPRSSAFTLAIRADPVDVGGDRLQRNARTVLTVWLERKVDVNGLHGQYLCYTTTDEAAGGEGDMMVHEVRLYQRNSWQKMWFDLHDGRVVCRGEGDGGHRDIFSASVTRRCVDPGGLCAS
jgi:hypothetical protein